MDIYVILAGFLVIILAVLIFSILKHTVKYFLLFFLIISLALGAGTFYVLKDAKDMKEKFLTADKLFVLTKDENVLTGFSFVDIQALDSLKAKSEQELINVEKSMINNDFANLTNTYYKIFLFNMSTFSESLENGINFSENPELTFSKQQIQEIIASNTPVDAVVDILLEQQDLESQGIPPAVFEQYKNQIRQDTKQEFLNNLNLDSEEEFKSYVFMLIFMDFLMEQGPEALISKIKTKDVKIIPKTAIFVALDIIPASLIGSGLESLPEFGGEEA